jgi:phosphoserine aminotransferase
MVPLNFLTTGGPADYIITGTWSQKARQRAEDFGAVNAVENADGSCTRAPTQTELKLSEDARYVHYVSNETIHGIEFPYDLDGGGVPVVCDASSNILSRPIEMEKYAMIYAGAQKNLGPSGVTLVIVREDFLETASKGINGVLAYRSFAENDSMPNTPNTWGVYLIDLVCKWLEEAGGLQAIGTLNARKASALYAAIDRSDGFYRGSVDVDSRSRMNVTFRMPSVELEDRFCSRAAEIGLVGLRGHRSVGGVRASMYNAFPFEGVERLVEYMNDFAGKNS